MKVYIQWATNPKSALEIIDSTKWKDTPSKPEPRNPKGTDNADSNQGWIQSISVMGRTVTGVDHVAVEHNPNGHPNDSVKVIIWSDDLSERTPDEIYAKEFTFEPIKQININGKLKWYCVQGIIMYMSDKTEKDLTTQGVFPMYCQQNLVKVKRYSEFVKPLEEITRHGIWLPDEIEAELEKTESHGYMEWVF